MVVTVLGRLADIKEENYKESKFFDVDINEWYGAYVAWAAEKGIANGITETEDKGCKRLVFYTPLLVFFAK